MSTVIMVGGDVHDNSIAAQIAIDQGQPSLRNFKGNLKGRKEMIKELLALSKKHSNATIWVAFEASTGGFGFYDELTASGIHAHILAPSKMPRSSKKKKNKSDAKDALHILEFLRGHVLAGNPIPNIWIPPKETRDDRELIRGRLAMKYKAQRVKNQIKSLLRRNGIENPEGKSDSWKSPDWRARLNTLSTTDPALPAYAKTILEKNLEEIDFYAKKIRELDKDIRKLSKTPRYKKGFKVLVTDFKGVGLITAMVFMTEVGDPRRFENRQQIGAYLGLTPGKDQSADRDTPKRITNEGSPRVSEVLCQAAWNRARFDPQESQVFNRIFQKNPKHKKIAVVALMRRLGVRMWHRWKSVNEETPEAMTTKSDGKNTRSKACRA